MALAAGPTLADHRFAQDAFARLSAEWTARGRRLGDYTRLWNLYWDELGPLAPTPESIHELEVVLIR